MKRPDEHRKLGTIETLLTALVGVGGGLFLGLYSFVQLRTAWMDGTVGLGRSGDFDYESEPLSYIVAMSALYPAAIVCGFALAIVSAVVVMRQFSGSRQRSGRRSR